MIDMFVRNRYICYKHIGKKYRKYKHVSLQKIQTTYVLLFTLSRLAGGNLIKQNQMQILSAALHIF